MFAEEVKGSATATQDLIAEGASAVENHVALTSSDNEHTGILYLTPGAE
jgi:hypothetical protein